jgi:hypothetical protein
MLYWRWLNHRHHPLTRLLFGVLGAVLLVGVLMLGFFALLAFAVIGTIVAITRAFVRAQAQGVRGQTTAAPADPRVIEGEFVVLRNETAPLKR